jgi:AcrR family transcriptional regulator
LAKHLDPVVADILNVATVEFAQYGLGGARLERILANTRSSKRMIYYHFASKEGLYQAVLEHVFETVRLREEDFDPNQGSPHDALIRFVENAFDAFCERPDFVRLLTFENLSGAVHIKGSALISKLNQRGLEHLETILARGQKAGVMRTNVAALDVFMNLVGLSYYHVANHAGYLAGGFSRSVVAVLEDRAFRQHRKKIILETTTRFVLRQLPDEELRSQTCLHA